MEAKRVLVQTVLAQLDIDICGAPADILPVLINIVNKSKGDPYLFLWSADGRPIAHGLFPNISRYGSALLASNVNKISSLIPGMDPAILQKSVLIAMSNSLSIGREISYPWLNGTTKTSYIIRILIGDTVYLLGA